MTKIKIEKSMDNTPEPSLLDYLKIKLNPFSSGTIEIPQSEEDGEIIVVNPLEVIEEKSTISISIPYRTILAIISALIAQRSLEPSPTRGFVPAILFYTVSVGLLIIAARQGEWSPSNFKLSDLFPDNPSAGDIPQTRLVFFPVAIVLGILTYLLFKTHTFNFLNLLFWFATVLTTIWVFWEGEINLAGIKSSITGWMQTKDWKINQSQILFVLVLVFGLWMRTNQLNTLPLEMTSDHAETTFDILSVLSGDSKVFFPRNTGREPLSIYIGAKMVSQIGFDNFFLAIKLGAALISGLTLVFVYLIAKELVNSRVGLISMGLLGIGYWPQVIARSTQGFEIAPLFWSIVFYLCIRGFKGNSRNPYLLAGLFVGIGLYGYAAFRIVPLVIFILFTLLAITIKDRNTKWILFYGFLMVSIIAIVVALPITRFAIDKPEVYGYRMFTRLSGLEKPIEGSAITIFLKNIWDALNITSWNGGGTWTFSVANRPSLDVVTGAFYHLGVIFLFYQLLFTKSKKALLLLASIPLLLLPSALSITFPIENPSLSRAGMAIIPIFIVAAISMEKLLLIIKRQENKIIKNLSSTFFTVLLLLSFAQNRDLVFNQYAENYQANSRNTQEIGEVVKSFIKLAGTEETNYSIIYPHWADTRLIMINAGHPGLDNAMAIEEIEKTVLESRIKLFILHPDDLEALEKLSTLYPNSWWERYPSAFEKDFILFYVPSIQ